MPFENSDAGIIATCFDGQCEKESTLSEEAGVGYSLESRSPGKETYWPHLPCCSKDVQVVVLIFDRD